MFIVAVLHKYEEHVKKIFRLKNYFFTIVIVCDSLHSDEYKRRVKRLMERKINLEQRFSQ